MSWKVIIVEDVRLELKGTEEIFRNEIPEAEVIGTAMTEEAFWPLMEKQLPDMVLLDLGLGGSTTIGVEICRNIRKKYPSVKVLIVFTYYLTADDISCVINRWIEEFLQFIRGKSQTEVCKTEHNKSAFATSINGKRLRRRYGIVFFAMGTHLFIVLKHLS